MTTVEKGICSNEALGPSDTDVPTHEVFVQVVDRKGTGVGTLEVQLVLYPMSAWTSWTPLPADGMKCPIAAEGADAEVFVRGKVGNVLVGIGHRFPPITTDRIVFVLSNVG